MDDESGDGDKEGLTSEWGGESRQDSLDEMNLNVDSKDELMHI